MKWKMFERRNNTGNSRRENLEDYEQKYISRLKEDLESEFL